MKGRHGSNFEIVTSKKTFDHDSRCVFTWRAILPNSISIKWRSLRRFLTVRINNTRNDRQEQDERQYE